MLITQNHLNKNVNNSVITSQTDTLWLFRHTFCVSLTHEKDEAYKEGKAEVKGSKSQV